MSVPRSLATRLHVIAIVAISVTGCTAAQPDRIGDRTRDPTTSNGSPGAAGTPALTASAPPWSVPNLNASRHVSCDITGNMQELPIKLYGLFDVHGGDDHLLVLQEALLGEPFVYEELTVDSVVWARSNGDAWEQRAGEAQTVDRLRRSIDQAAGWTNVEPQPSSGQASQRMKAAGSPVDVSDFGFIYPDGFDSSLSLEIETNRDGTPLGMHIAGDSFQAELSCAGRPLSRPVVPPTWKPVEMSQGVSVAVPEGWGINRSEPSKLVVFGPDPQWLAVQGATAEGMTLDEWTTDGAAYFSKEWDAKLEAVTSIMVADEPASLATWHLPIDGVETHFLNVSAIRDGWGYDIEFFSQTGRVPADRALFEQVLTTVVFGKK